MNLSSLHCCSSRVVSWAIACLPRAVIIAVLLVAAESRYARAQEEAPRPSPAVDPGIVFERLATSQGDIYLDVRVRTIQPDALLIEHRGGMARVSLFDLPDEIRDNYGFDYDQAMAHYKQRDAEQRTLRKKQMLERVRLQAAEEQTNAKELFDSMVRAEWIPVRATIVALKEGGALARVDRIVMRPTRTVSALGGEGLPGPPRRTYQRISDKPVFLKGLGSTIQGSTVGKKWTGYIWPDGHVSLNAELPDRTTPAYRAAKGGR